MAAAAAAASAPLAALGQRARGKRCRIPGPSTSVVRCLAAQDDKVDEPENREAKVEALEGKLRAGKKKKQRAAAAAAAAAAASGGFDDGLPKPEKKAWESMSLLEKAWELYIRREGLLDWINKLAFAMVFVIAGGWVAFRFVGPALGLYQLDSPLLPPQTLLEGPKS